MDPSVVEFNVTLHTSLYHHVYGYLYASVSVHCFLHAGYQTLTSQLMVTIRKEEPFVPQSLCFS